MQEAIEVGYQAFVSDGGEEFGAVREVRPNGRPEMVIYVENCRRFSSQYLSDQYFGHFFEEIAL